MARAEQPPARHLPAGAFFVSAVLAPWPSGYGANYAAADLETHMLEGWIILFDGQSGVPYLCAAGRV